MDKLSGHRLDPMRGRPDDQRDSVGNDTDAQTRVAPGILRQLDPLSMFGLLVAVLAVFGGQALEGGHLRSLINVPALVIVLGGTVGATMLQVPLHVFRHAMQMASWIFRPPASDHAAATVKLVHWGQLARRKGMLSLEAELSRETDGLMRRGLQLLVDGHEPAAIREALEFDLDNQESFGLRGARVYESMGGYAPTIGIIGAVMGLIHVMENLSEPGRLGAGIASAFVATIYGVGFANLVFVPFSRKLKDIVQNRARDRELIVEGIVAIAHGDNPRTIVESRAVGTV